MAKTRRKFLGNPNDVYRQYNLNPELQYEGSASLTVRQLKSGDGKSEEIMHHIQRARLVRLNGKGTALVARAHAKLFRPKFTPELFFKKIGAKNWIYYPEVLEATEYDRASKFSVPGGINEMFSGSVGVVRGNLLENKDSKTLNIFGIQSSYDIKKSGINKTIESKHRDWRTPVFEQMFLDANRMGVDFLSLDISFFMEKGKINQKGKILVDSFTQLAIKNNFIPHDVKVRGQISFRKK